MELVELASDGRRATHDAMCDPEGNGWQCDERFAADDEGFFLCVPCSRGGGLFMLDREGTKKGSDATGCRWRPI